MPAMLETANGPLKVEATAFIPDWKMTGTKERLVKDVGFEWKGEGWYFTKGVRESTGEPYEEAMLIIPCYYDDKDEPKNPEERSYLLCMYNHNRSADAFNWIVNARVAVDER